MDKKVRNARLAVLVVIGFLLIIAVRYFIQARQLSIDLAAANAKVSTYQTNAQVLSFARLFIDKVLNSNGPVDFDTRLQLENSVRDIKDPELFNQWNAFVNSKSESEAQTAAKQLLSMIARKI